MRSGPSTEYEKVQTLKGDTYIITCTGKTENLWAEVSVDYYEDHPCNGGSKVQNWKGWIKFLDDKGFPNIWYYTRGC